MNFRKEVELVIESGLQRLKRVEAAKQKAAVKFGKHHWLKSKFGTSQRSGPFSNRPYEKRVQSELDAAGDEATLRRAHKEREGQGRDWTNTVARGGTPPLATDTRTGETLPRSVKIQRAQLRKGSANLLRKMESTEIHPYYKKVISFLEEVKKADRDNEMSDDNENRRKSRKKQAQKNLASEKQDISDEGIPSLFTTRSDSKAAEEQNINKAMDTSKSKRGRKS
jgi:hypothetical protein